jgi:ACT domain-containing protein
MKVSIDGKPHSEVGANGVRVIYKNLETEDGEPVELHVNLTHEGIILDVWDLKTREGITFEGILGTSSETAQEIVDRLVD